jgi:hypothetical protein
LAKKKRNRNRRHPKHQDARSTGAATNNQAYEKTNDSDVKSEPSKNLSGQSTMRQQIVAWLDELTIQRLGLIVAAGLLIATWYQSWLARETLHQSERAFVYVKELHLMGVDPAHPIPQGKTGGISIDFKNSGSTPARNVTHWITACVKRGLLPRDYSYPRVNPNGDIYLIPPHSDSKDFVALSPSLLEAIRDSKAVSPIVWGSIAYSDVFYVTHQTQFCFFYGGSVVGAEGPSNIWTMCPQHNCIDEDCPDKWGDNADEQECPTVAKPN